MARTGAFFPGCPHPVIPQGGVMVSLLMVITMTAGTAMIMWLGEQITERGVGNGMSLLIFTSIAASFPDRKSTRLNSSHVAISYAVFCLKKKKNPQKNITQGRTIP